MGKLKVKTLIIKTYPKKKREKFQGSKELDGLMGLVTSVQVEPIKGTLMHVEFLAVTEDQNVVVSIPVNLTGTPDCIRQGTATVNQIIYEISIECLATKIPVEFILDISNLEAGESLHASDLNLPDYITLKSGKGLTIVTAFVDKRSATVEATEEGVTAAAAAGKAAPAAAGKAAPGAAPTPAKK